MDLEEVVVVVVVATDVFEEEVEVLVEMEVCGS